MIRIVLADDHAIVREGLKHILASQSDFQVVGEAGDGNEALRLAGALEDASEHPIAAAVARGARDRIGDLPAVEAFSSTQGRGVQGQRGARQLGHQLVAEAVHRVQAGEQWWLEQELESVHSRWYDRGGAEAQPVREAAPQRTIELADGIEGYVRANDIAKERVEDIIKAL